MLNNFLLSKNRQETSALIRYFGNLFLVSTILLCLAVFVLKQLGENLPCTMYIIETIPNPLNFKTGFCLLWLALWVPS